MNRFKNIIKLCLKSVIRSCKKYDIDFENLLVELRKEEK
jgi:hypothetical protein